MIGTTGSSTISWPRLATHQSGFPDTAAPIARPTLRRRHDASPYRDRDTIDWPISQKGPGQFRSGFADHRRPTRVDVHSPERHDNAILAARDLR